MLKINEQLLKNLKKVIFLDVDGTLLTDDKTVSTYTKEIFKQLHEHGVKIILNSGRCRKSMEWLVNTYLPGCIDALICADGRHIYDLNEQKSIYIAPINPEFIYNFYREAVKKSCITYYITEQDMYTTQLEDELQKYMDSLFDNGDFLNTNLTMTRINNVDFVKKESCVRIFCYHRDLKPLEQLKEMIERTTDYQIKIRFEKNRYALFVGIPSNKAQAMKWYCDYFNISHDNTIAFGDELNDVELLKEAKLSFAMKNANENLKEYANQITEYTNNDD